MATGGVVVWSFCSGHGCEVCSAWYSGVEQWCDSVVWHVMRSWSNLLLLVLLLMVVSFASLLSSSC